MGLFPGVNREFEIEVDGLRFGGEFPLPSDRRNIDLRIAQRLAGIPLASIPNETYSAEFVFVTLNYVLRERPKEFEGQDFAEYPNEDFTVRLWNEYRTAEKAYQEALKKNNRTTVSQKPNREEPRQLPKSVSSKRVQDIAERIPD